MVRVTIHKDLNIPHGLHAQVSNLVGELRAGTADLEAVPGSVDPRVRTVTIAAPAPAGDSGTTGHSGIAGDSGSADRSATTIVFSMSGRQDDLVLLYRVLPTAQALAEAPSLEISLNAVNGVTTVRRHEAAPSHAEGENVDPSVLTDQLGVDPAVAARVAADPEHVDQIVSSSPAWERDAVYGILAGMTPDEVREDLDLPPPTQSPANAAEFSAPATPATPPASSTPATPATPPEPTTPATTPNTPTRKEETDGDAHGLDKQKPQPPATEDDALIASLNTPAARMEFLLDPDEDELADILNHGTFSDWRVFLHPSQRQAVQAQFSGSGRISGGAGTGKTVVVIHRARRLAGPDDAPTRVLVTTFTRALAESLSEQLNILDPAFPEAATYGAPGIYVSGIDALIVQVIRNSTIAEVTAATSRALGVQDLGTKPTPLGGWAEDDLWAEAAAQVAAQAAAQSGAWAGVEVSSRADAQVRAGG